MMFSMPFKSFLRNMLVPSLKEEDDTLAYWRERILLAMLACGVAGSSLAFPPSMIVAVRERLWSLAVSNVLAFAATVYLLFSRNLSYRLKAVCTLLIIYAVSVNILLNAGIISGAPAWLFAFSTLAGLLLGLKAAWISILINLATLSTYWFAFNHGILVAQYQFFSTPERAFAALVNYMMLNTAAAISAAVMVKGLESANRGQKKAAELRKQEAEALHQAQALLEAAINQSPAGIIIADAPGVRIRLVNAAAFAIWGGVSGDLTGIDIEEHTAKWRLLHPDGTPYEPNNLPLARAILKGEISKDVEVIVHDQQGLERWVSANAAPVTDANGNVVAGISIFQDITERKRADEVLKQSEEKFRTTFQGSPDAITITARKDGRFVEVNDGFTKMSGYAREEVIGKSPLELNLIVDLEDRMAFEEKLMQDGEVDGFEMKYRTKEGVVRDTLLAARPLYFMDEPCLVAVVKDVSEMKRTAKEKTELEKQLQHAQKMESMGTLAGGIAHDFNNLLMGIQGRTSLMLMDKDSSHPDVEHLKGIEDYVQNAVTLTRQLLGFARGGKYEVKPSDINELVRKNAELFGRTRKEINIHAKYHPHIWTVAVDQGQIGQVMMNLFINAWQAMPEGGELFLATHNVVLDEEYVKPFSIAPGRYVKIAVADTGVGMDAATQKRIFDPFFTTKEMGRGTGLGLASAYGIIKNHGGIINVASEKGEGATFTVYLPASESKVQNAGPKPIEGLRRGNETVLLVDDERIILETAEALLRRLGYEVLTASGGEEAVRLYGERGDRIDVVILDMIMPGMSGGDTFDRLKGINPHIKTILASGYSLNGNAQDILDRGCDAFIQKPFKIEELSGKLEAILTP
jgi:two-component system cell cycle sensor histidine kinase/response regulator CckA